MPRWESLVTADGSWTLVHPLHGEACHSTSGAWTEAVERYARPCRLRARGNDERLRLLDVGTGLGLNVAAALHELAGARARLLVTTIERDRSVLAAALASPARVGAATGPWEHPLARVHDALGRALRYGRQDTEVALGAGARLRLLLGDARTVLPTAPAAFDAVFLDPFSPRREPELWTHTFLARLARVMAPGSWLSTYTASLAVRRGLARGGLRVGRGPRVGTKAEGTLASPDLRPPPLTPRQARRVRRGSGNAPAGG